MRMRKSLSGAMVRTFSDKLGSTDSLSAADQNDTGEYLTGRLGDSELRDESVRKGTAQPGRERKTDA